MFIATKSYSPGDVIVEKGEPQFYKLVPEMTGTHCESCFKSGSTKRCSACSSFSYCGKECAKKDWHAFHKHGECELYKKVKGSRVLDQLPCKRSVLFSIRVYLTLKTRPELTKKEYQLPNGTTKTFEDLVSNVEGMKRDPDQMMLPYAVSKLLGPSIEGFDVDQWFAVYGKLSSNSFICYDEVSGELPLASLFRMEKSFFNHSCRPNAGSPALPKTSSMLTAIDEIAPGDEITISYIDLFGPRDERRRRLKKSWYFDCECVRCSNPEEEQVIQKELLDLSEKIMNLRLLLRNQNNGMRSRQLFELSLKKHRLLEKLTGRFNGDLAEPLYELVFLRMSLHQHFSEKQSIKNLWEELIRLLEISHGKESPMYARIMNSEQAYFIKRMF